MICGLGSGDGDKTEYAKEQATSSHVTALLLMYRRTGRCVYHVPWRQDLKQINFGGGFGRSDTVKGNEGHVTGKVAGRPAVCPWKIERAVRTIALVARLTCPSRHYLLGTVAYDAICTGDARAGSLAKGKRAPENEKPEKNLDSHNGLVNGFVTYSTSCLTRSRDIDFVPKSATADLVTSVGCHGNISFIHKILSPLLLCLRLFGLRRPLSRSIVRLVPRDFLA